MFGANRFIGRLQALQCGVQRRGLLASGEVPPQLPEGQIRVQRVALSPSA